MYKDKTIALIALLTFITIIAACAYFFITYGWVITVMGIVILVLLLVITIRVKNSLKRSKLIKKYQDEDLVSRIMQRTLWQGQTAEQVIDAIGEPKDIDEKVLKTKIKQTWKYFPSGRRRYGLRITLDDNIVVGWDKKI